VAALSSEAIRNVCLVGHIGTGKTSLAEALLFKAGAIKRRSTIAEKNTVSDFDPEEKERGMSLDAALMHCAYAEKHLNIIDCPGFADFIAGAVQGLAATETTVLTVNAVAGVEVLTRKLWSMSEGRGLARILALTRMDDPRAKFTEHVETLKELFGPAVTPLFLPIGVGESFKGVYNLLSEQAPPPEIAEQADALRKALLETAVSSDDALMERYLMDEKLTPEEISGCFAKALKSGALVPLVCVSAEKDVGVKEFLDVLAHLTPSPSAARPKMYAAKDGRREETELEPKADGPFYAQAIKTKRDQFIGKLTWIRIWSGGITLPAPVRLAAGSRPERLSVFLRIQGKEATETTEAVCGDILALSKIETLSFSDTLTTALDDPRLFNPLPFPIPMSALAVSAKSRNDEARISGQLRSLCDSDPTFIAEVDAQTKELVIRGLGQTHLDIMLGRLRKNGIEVNTKIPNIAYRSTIAGVAEIRYRHKKQSGGSGQFGECQIKIEPMDRGGGFEFLDEIFGGSIPSQYIPSVEKGIVKKMTEGVWPGIPVVDVRVRLNDGKHHEVDSKDIAFQIAGREAFKEAFNKAKPTILEPIVNLEVVFPGKYMGDIAGHLSSKRGRISGSDTLGDMQVMRAQAPASEVQGYAGELKSITGGEGFYSIEFSHYDPVPPNLAQPIILAAMKRERKEEE
jgi:elongation factor G